MNQNLRTFVAIFFFICGVVGLVLAGANLAQTPSATTAGVTFGAAGIVGFFAGWLLVKRPRY
jgi:hypothetical protein